MKRMTWVSVFALICLFNTGLRAEVVEISAECHWYGGAECKVTCDAVDFYVHCDPDVTLACNGVCTPPAVDVACTGSCATECEAACSLDPSNFDCDIDCQGNCGASCTASCASGADAAYCQAECAAFCNGECSASCDGFTTAGDCIGGCNASCQGSCQAQVDFPCQMNCQMDAYVTCEGTAKANCDGSCSATNGVVECQGEYMVQGEIDAAVQWVKDNLPEVQITYAGEAGCVGNECTAEGSATIACSSAPVRPSATMGLTQALITLF